MRKAISSVRRAVSQGHPTVMQLAGSGAVAWGLWDVRPWLGKAIGGLLVALFGLSAELGRRAD